MTEAKEPNLAVKIASDPALQKKIFSRLKEPQFGIPDGCEDLIKGLGTIKSPDKSVLISKATSPTDYQTQLEVLSKVQHLMDRTHDITTQLYFIQQHWNDLLKTASRLITLTYFDELNNLKDGVRKSVLAAVLQPIQDGVDRLQLLIERSEGTYKHLNGTVWNIKEGVEITKEFLTLLKYGNAPREL